MTMTSATWFDYIYIFRIQNWGWFCNCHQHYRLLLRH